MTTTKQSATDRYLELMSQVQAELAALQAKADNHFDANPDTLHWGHVGDLGNVLSLLQQANGKEV